MKKLTTASINGHDVDFFEPPHTEPDFPWVDVLQLARAFLPEEPATLMLKSTQRFDDGKTVKTIPIEGRLTTIMCHAMAQGLCGAIDQISDIDEDGPAFKAYCAVAGRVATEHWPMPIGEMLEAFHNQGGPFLRG
jgi:hypothetical protein